MDNQWKTAIFTRLQRLLGVTFSVSSVNTKGHSSARTRALTEHVRMRLARHISNLAAGDTGYVPLITLSPEWEQAFADAIAGHGDKAQLSMAPSKLQEFIVLVRETFDTFSMMGETLALVTSPAIRPFVRSIVERFRPATLIMSQNEVHPRVKSKRWGRFRVLVQPATGGAAPSIWTRYPERTFGK